MKDTLPCMMLVNARTTESFTLGGRFFEMPLLCTASQVKLANGKRRKSALDSARAARPHNKVAGLLCRHTHGPEGGGGDFFSHDRRADCFNLLEQEHLRSTRFTGKAMWLQSASLQGVNGCLELGPL